MCLQENGLIIGSIGYSTIDHDPLLSSESQFEFGYSLHPDYWGLGYATEVSVLMRDHLMDVEQASCIWLRHFDFNRQSEKVILKL
ncbi:GNAT family N-acetyltransferase [Fusibacter sp. A1]|uniref:GNAT family N-acetyltransferase n=1 Tax=Fusibacter sp. A1 TaxID=2283630 RepID=UPI00352D8B0A